MFYFPVSAILKENAAWHSERILNIKLAKKYSTGDLKQVKKRTQLCGELYNLEDMDCSPLFLRFPVLLGFSPTRNTYFMVFWLPSLILKWKNELWGWEKKMKNPDQL